MKYLPVFIIFLFGATILQSSFLVHFRIWNFIPPLTLLIILTWSLYENRERNSGYLIAASGGLFLDIFSSNLIGFWIFASLAICFLAKKLKKHVKIPFSQEI